MTYKSVNTLKIYRQNHFVGLLKRTDQGCQFVFDEKFDETPFEGLSYKIPHRKDSYEHSGVNLPPFFAGLLPEGLRLNVLVEKLKTSPDDLFSLLAASGERCVGDVYAQAEGIKRPVIEIPKIGEIDFYEFFDQSIEMGTISHVGESLAGVQEKLSASMLSFPVHTVRKHKSYILKLNPKNKPNLIQNEYKCLQLARKCGLEVNDVTLVHDKNKNLGLLVERFDRLEEQDNLVMIHQEDACQFLDRYPADKYRISYREIAEGINQFATAPAIEILKLVQLYAFSYLMGNGDLHAKNVSLQTNGSGRTTLTPAYDLICTYIYKDHNMALQLEGRDNNIKRSDLLKFGKRHDINEKALGKMLTKLLSLFQKHKNLLFQIPMEEKKLVLLEKTVQKRFEDLA